MALKINNLRCSVCCRNEVWKKGKFTSKFSHSSITLTNDDVGGADADYNFCPRRKCQRIALSFLPNRKLWREIKFNPYPRNKLFPFPKDSDAN